MNMKKTKKLLAIIGMTAILLTLPGCSGCSINLNLFNRDSKDNSQNNARESELLSYSSDEIHEIYRIQLSADRTDFYEGEDGSFTLTVTVPEEILLEDVELELTDGESTLSAGTIHTDEFHETGDGTLSVSKTLLLHTDKSGKYELWACSGKYRSSELILFTTPHITKEQVMESIQVGEDLTAALSEKFNRKVSAKKLARAAEKILKNDSRVAETERVGTSVYYSTTACVAGAFYATPQDPEILSSGGERGFEENSDAVEAYEKFGPGVSTVDDFGNPTRLESGKTSTNGSSLILRPATNAMKSFEMGQLESAADKIKSKADGITVDIMKDDTAVQAILSREIDNYGTVFLQTHGGIMEKSGEQCGVHFLMYQTTSLLKTKSAENLYNKMMEYAEIDYAASNGRQGSAQEVEEFYSNFYGKLEDISAWRLWKTNSPDLKKGYIGELHMSSTYIMQKYGNRNFDNTVFYIGACHGFSYDPFIKWLVKRGCKVVLGYFKSVSTPMSLIDINDLFDQLMKESAEENWRLENIDEAGKNGENRLLNFNENMFQRGLRFIAPAFNASKRMLYIGSGDFFYSGISTIQGKVYYAYEEDPEPEDLKPASGINVRSYLFLNQRFSQKTTGITGQDGSFVLPDMRSGLYVLSAIDPSGEEKLVSVILDQEKIDSGKIILPAEPVVDVLVENEEGERITDAEVVFTGVDGSTANGVLTATKSKDQAFRATLSEQEYEITVNPGNDDYIQTSIKFTVSSGYPRRHELTIRLQKYFTVSGTVFDEETEEPLSSVVVAASGDAGESTAVSENGNYTIKGLKQGDCTLTFAKEGYESRSLDVSVENNTILPDLYLKRDNERTLLIQYLNEKLVPVFGTADGINAKFRNSSQFASYNETYGMLNNRILGSMIADLDLDGHPEMVTIQLLFREEPDPDSNYPAVHYAITYYDVKNNKVRQVDSAETEAVGYYTVGHFMTLISGNPDECKGGPKEDPGAVRLVTAWYGWDEYSSTKRQYTIWSFTDNTIEYDLGANSIGANQHSWLYRVLENGDKTIVFESKQNTVIAGSYRSFQEAFEQEFIRHLSEIGLEDFMSGAFLASPSNLKEYIDKIHFVSYVDTEKDGTVYTGPLNEYISESAE